MDITSHEKERNKKMPTQRHKVTYDVMEFEVVMIWILTILK